MTRKELTNFTVFTEKPIDKKEELINEVVLMWSNYGNKYRTNPKTYEKLLQRKTELGLALKNGRLKKSAERDYPRNRIFDFEEKEQLIAYLNSLTEGRIAFWLEECQMTTLNDTFRAMDAYICDAKYDIFRAEKRLEELENERAVSARKNALYSGLS